MRAVYFYQTTWRYIAEDCHRHNIIKGGLGSSSWHKTTAAAIANDRKQELTLILNYSELSGYNCCQTFVATVD
jgi:hypothetical protein